MFLNRGWIIKREKVKVYPDDTLLDVFLTVQDKEQQMMIDTINLFNSEQPIGYEFVEEGNYFKALPPELETILLEAYPPAESFLSTDNFVDR